MRWLALVLLASCAAPQGEFRDGARLPPPEPHTSFTPAGAGLPEYWAQPEAEAPPRSPYTRVLPQTPQSRKQPGIWAAGGQTELPVIHLANVGFELPADVTVFEWDTAALCGHNLKAAGGVELNAISGLPDWVRACAVSRLYLGCLNGVRREAERRKASGVEYDAVAFKAFDRLHGAARHMEKISCKTQPTAETTQALTAILGRMSFK